MAKGTPQIPVIWNPQGGGMNSDTDFQSFRGGDLWDALNIRATGQGENVAPDYENIKGNKFKYALDAPVTQAKIIRLTINTNTDAVGYTETVYIYRANGTLIFSFTWNITGNDFVTTETDFEADMAAAVPAGYTYTVTPTTVNTTTGYIDIEFTAVPGYASGDGWEWSMGISNTFRALTTSIVTIQEAYDSSVIGPWSLIGSYDITGEDFQFFTTARELQQVAGTVIDCIDDGGGLIQIETASAHGLVDGQSVRVTGIKGTLPTDTLDTSSTGEWTVTLVSATEFKLASSAFPGGAVYASGGTVYTNIYGLGQIGVAVEDVNTDTIGYTRLIMSKEFDFRAIKQIDSKGKKSSTKYSIYYTDWYNVPRVFYYKGAFTTDGAINTNNPNGFYNYGSIAEESRLSLSFFSSILDFTQQVQSGGSLVAGNKRYAFRYVSENLVSTEWSDLINPVNVFAASTQGDPLLLWGNDEGTVTGKMHILTLTGIPVNVFKYVELAVVEYIGNVISGKILRRDALDGNPSQQLYHTGFENNTTELDLGTLNLKYSNVATARNIDILNNRLILSNLSYEFTRDFSEFCQTWKHEILKDTVPGVGNEVDGTYVFGEYFDPISVNQKVGYMMNDTYRFMAKFRLKAKYGGGITPSYWIDDIRFDCEANNVTTPNRRNGAPADYDITTQYGVGVEPDPYVWYVEFQDIPMNFLIDGIPAKELIDQIIIERAERVPEILGMGYVSPAVDGRMVGALGEEMYYPPTGGGAYVTLGEFPFYSGCTFDSYNAFGLGFAPDHQDYPASTAGAPRFNPQRTYGSMYCMDWIYGNGVAPTSLANDGLIVYGNPEKSQFYPTGTPGKPTLYQNQYSQYNGATGQAVKPAPIVINEGFPLGFNQMITVNGLDYNKTLELNPAAPIKQWGQQYGWVGFLNAPLTDINTYGNSDYGFYICQYYREKSNYASYDPDTCKYGARNTTVSEPTGAIYNVPDNVASLIDIPTYGGDVFCQKTFFKHRYPVVDDAGGTQDMGFGGGVAFYSLNITNTQMRRPKSPTITEIYPKYPLVDWLQEEDSNPQGLDPALYYNMGYNIRNGINVNPAYDSNLEYIQDAPADIIWSEPSVPDSPADNLRVFLPLNKKSLDVTDGPITHHTVSNGELLTIQLRRYMRQFFNSTGILTTTEGSEVIMGSGAVMNRTGVTMTTYGSNHKWSCVKGKSKGGHDVDYWFDIESGIMMRLGYDGSVPISRVQNMRAFFENRTTWVRGKDTPAYEQGICAVWNDRFSEAQWTFRGRRVVDEWSDVVVYTEGQVVNLADNNVFTTFEHFDTIYIVNTGQTSSAGVRPDADSVVWSRIAVTDLNYYNFYTIVWSEIKNRFQCRQTPKPKIYAKMWNYFLSPRPVLVPERMYKHDDGNRCEWYEFSGDAQVEDGFISMVINTPADAVKTFQAQRFDTEITPYRVDWITKFGQSYADEADFETLEGKSDVCIFNDSTLSGNNKGDTSMLYGEYLITKLTFRALFYQKLTNIITKLIVRARTYGN